MTIVFAHLWAFAALPLPIVIYSLLPAAPLQPVCTLKIPYFKNFADTSSKKTPNRGFVFTIAIIWLLLISSAARPQWLGEPLPLPLSGRDLLLAVDISDSMTEQDMVIGARVVDRLTMVKAIAGDFIQRREGDRIGLILFGQQAYLQTPLTFDRETVRTLLFEAEVGLAGRSTAIGDAIGLAIKRLKNDNHDGRVLIVLTDGANTAGSLSPDKAADLAADIGIRIYTIGIGAEPRGFFGVLQGRYLLDEKNLRSIAEKTGGRYFRAHNARELDDIYKLLDQLEPINSDQKQFRPRKELYAWPLMMAFLFSIGAVLWNYQGRLIR
jgi:Ca-activated chloride channel family protein